MNFVRAYYRLGLVVILALLSVAMVIPLFIRQAVEPLMYTSIEQVPPSEVALVLGASVVHGIPSPLLARRADTAVALYKAGKVSKILVTGDNGALSYDEVTPVRKYVLDAGIPTQDIFLDHAGFDTYSSVYRARDVFAARSVIIVTQDFHLPRALWIARRLGLSAYGVVAEGSENSAFDYLREIPASIKAIVDVLVRRQPKYLGPAIPLSGNGEATWY